MRQLLTKTEYKQFEKAEYILAWLQWRIEKRLGGDLWNLNGDSCEDWKNTEVGELVINLSNINITLQDNDIKDLVGKKLSKQDLKIIQKG